MKKQFMRLMGVACVVSTLTACGLVSDEPGQSKDILTPKNIKVARCADVNDPVLDERLMDANSAALDSLANMLRAMNNRDMASARQSAPRTSLAVYDSILVRYPGHCGAQFGKAIVTLANLVNDAEVSSALDRVAGEEESETYASLLNGGLENAPVGLIKLSRQVATAQDPWTVTRAQNMLAQRVLPRVDSAIAYLNNIMAFDDFYFDIRIDEDGDTTYKQIDKGEVGPALAALKLIKAILVTFVSVDLEIAQDGSYAFLDTLEQIDDEDFDQLRPGQRAALDHILGLTRKNALLTTVKPDWESRYAAIPQLLESALDDLQNGLRFGIRESSMDENVQKYDIYRVGNGSGYHVSPQKLQEGIDHLERLRKYLRGRVEIRYAKGSKTLTVDFPKFFRITKGFQDFLPYHVVRPYEEWNDVAGLDTVWSSWFNFHVDNDSYHGEGAGVAAARQVVAAVYGDPEAVRVVETDWFSPSWTLSNGERISIRVEGCDLFFAVNGGEEQSIRMNACRVVNGEPLYMEYVERDVLGPFYFTDARGNPTFGRNINRELDSLIDHHGWGALRGRIVFPDPTLGGVFPGLTNDNFFETVAALSNVRPRSNCVERDEWGYCVKRVLPSNPSDLDVLKYYFDGL